MSNSAAAIEIHDLTVHYQHRPVLWGIDCVIPEGERAVIVGPNGAGKSTLLKTILGLVPSASGYVSIFGAPVKERRALIAYVPQRSEIDWDFPIQVFDVVLMGREAKLPFYRRPSAHDRERALNALEQVGMQDLRGRQIGQLSGGQQQRVFIARALAQDATLYLLDEPFAGVDAATERIVADLFVTLQKQGKTIVAVHHDLQTVADYFSWCLLLNVRLVAAGLVKDCFTPEQIQKTYGSRLGVLTEMGERLRTQEWRERAE
jgi:manganese/zinc/iron transport system ATP- binding protein